MEPTSLITAALVAGATKAAGDIPPDIYNCLKALIKRKFAGNQRAEMVLEEHEKDPETYEAPLKKKLEEAEADKDKEIIQKAQELLKQLEAEKSASGKINLKVDGDFMGFAGENQGTVNQTFNKK